VSVRRRLRPLPDDLELPEVDLELPEGDLELPEAVRVVARRRELPSLLEDLALPLP
jgi:hypothetical protein